MLNPRFLSGVVLMSIDTLQESAIVWPKNMVTLSRQCCRVPSSAIKTHALINISFFRCPDLSLNSHFVVSANLFKIKLDENVVEKCSDTRTSIF